MLVGKFYVRYFNYMSKIAKNSIKMPEDTTCAFDNNVLLIKGKLGSLSLSINNSFTVKNDNNEIFVLPINDKDKINPMWGTTAAHIANSIKGYPVSFMRNVPKWHYRAPNKDEYLQAIEEINKL